MIDNKLLPEGVTLPDLTREDKTLSRKVRVDYTSQDFILKDSAITRLRRHISDRITPHALDVTEAYMAYAVSQAPNLTPLDKTRYEVSRQRVVQMQALVDAAPQPEDFIQLTIAHVQEVKRHATVCRSIVRGVIGQVERLPRLRKLLTAMEANYEQS